MNRFLSFLSVLVFVSYSYGQISEKALDQLITDTRKAFDVPGISVGITHNGKVIYAKGDGLRSMRTGAAMNENTLVGIASNSKGFTATALMMLQDEGKLSINDKVQKYIPEFEMYDPYVSKEITIKDLITHRAGLGLGQGDLMFFPEGGTLKIQDIVERVKYLKPENGFRETLDYNNILFIIAGEVITRVSGLSWADFIETRILKPVGMSSSFGSYLRASGVENKIDAHAPVDGKVNWVPHDWNETANAAGGIMSNIPDMLTWAEFLMNGFTTKDGKKLVSDRGIQSLWQIQQPAPVSLNGPYDTKMYGYGLGWFISDVKGKRQIQHSGGLIGTVTLFTLIPELNLGIVVLTNQQSGAAFNTITNTIKDSYLGIPDRGWLKTYKERGDKATERYNKQKADAYAKAKEFSKNKSMQLKDADFTGIYNDPWFGDMEVKRADGKLRIDAKTSPRLKGELIPYSPTAFIIKWDDRSYDADAYFILSLDKDGKAKGAKIDAISDITDFSFDFDDLVLSKVEKK